MEYSYWDYFKDELESRDWKGYHFPICGFIITVSLGLGALISPLWVLLLLVLLYPFIYTAHKAHKRKKALENSLRVWMH